MTSTRLILLMTLTATGCQLSGLSGRKQEARYVEPVLSQSIGLNDLVDYLNAKTEGLSSWRCLNTQVHVKGPDLPFPQKLKGTLACSAPGSFRLVCDNTMGHADFGSNQDICWAYVKPGNSEVLTWKHEDSALLQYLPGGLPRLEPEWLMTVLGVQPLNPDRYELQNAPLGSREVWMVAIEDAPDGSSLRRVIKVDTVLGVIRRHALYDSDANPLLIADLSDYKSSGGHELPHTVHIQFPATETHLTLKFTGIETGCQIADTLWHPPQGRNMEVVDLGHVIRSRMEQDPQFARRQNLSTTAPTGSKTAFDADGRTLHDGPPVSSRTLSSQEANDIHLTGDERYYGAEASENSPQWDDAEEDVSREERFERELTEDSAIPDFDVVAPSKSVKKRSRWFPFWKK